VSGQTATRGMSVAPTVLIGASLLLGLGIVSSPLLTLAICGSFALAFSVGRSARPLLVVFLLFIIFQDPLVVFVGGETTPAGVVVKRLDEVLILLLGSWCLLSSRRVHAVLTHRPIALCLACCYAGLLLSTAFHPTGWVPAAIDFALFSKPFLIFLIGVSAAPEDSVIAAGRDRILIVMVSSVLFGLVFLMAPQLQDAYVGFLQNRDERMGFLSAQGFFINPGTFSWFAAATFGLCYAAYLVYQRAPYLVAAVVTGGLTVLSWRRKSILAILGMILISMLLRSRRGARVRALIMVLLIAMIGITVFAPYAIELWSATVREYGGPDPLVAARNALYYTSVLIARDHFPLGLGLASFGSHASKLYYSDAYQAYGLTNVWGLSPTTANFITDTYWPMVLGEGGVLSLVSFFGFFYVLFRTTWRVARAPVATPEFAYLVTSALLLFTGSVVESTASHAYGSSMNATLGLMPLGMLMGRLVDDSGAFVPGQRRDERID
jgi:hypothetical protein